MVSDHGVQAGQKLQLEYEEAPVEQQKKDRKEGVDRGRIHR